MKLLKLYSLFTACILFSGLHSAIADDEIQVSALHDWQLQRLMQPSKQQLAMETSSQKVFVYSGIKDREVDKALDKNFDRMQSLMFTNVIRTDKSGGALRNPETGVVLTEDDGCD